MSDVVIARRHGQGMLTLRGSWDDLAPVLGAEGLAAPPQRGIATGGGLSVAWMSPDEALVLCDRSSAPDLARRVSVAAGDAFVTVADVSDARAVFDLAGPWADDALAKLTPADLSAVGPDEMRRSRIAQVAAAFWRIEGGWRIVCFRSVADYVEGLLHNAVDGGALTPT